MKCPNDNECLDPVWIMPNRYWHCWLCDTYFSGRNKEDLVSVDNKTIEQKQREAKILEELGY